MPAAHDVYAEQLSELRRGYPLYYPEPHPQDGPVEIGDVGYTKQGAFYRLFNVSRPPSDPAHRLLGVPDDFEPLDMSIIRRFEAALEPGPLHSRTVSTLDADIGTQGGILPVEASFRFSCASKRGAILMLESQMSREEAVQNQLLESYLHRHCHSWHAFASSHHIHLGFGDLMLVTECSKTAAWSSAVYSNSSREFGLAFSVGNPFLPSSAGVSASTGLERTGPVERRRSQYRAQPQNPPLPNTHTVFVKAYRLATRQVYYQSMVSLFMKTLDPIFRERADNTRSRRIRSGTASDTTLAQVMSSSPRSPQESSYEIIRPDEPDFHPAISLLGLAMETGDSECVVVHDDAWCSASLEESQMIEQYADFHFNLVDSMLSSMYSTTDLVDGMTQPQSDDERFSVPGGLERGPGSFHEVTDQQTKHSRSHALYRHEKYFLAGGDLYFLAQNALFCVHRHFFERESPIFQSRLMTTASPGAAPQGSTESNAIVLDDIASEDFAKFLWVFYNPNYSLYDRSAEDWKVVLRVAYKWEFNEVKTLAIRELEKLELPDVDRIVTYRRFGVEGNLLIPPFAALCAREEPLTLREGSELGIETTLMIARAREYARANPTASVIRSQDEMHSFLRKLLDIQPSAGDSKEGITTPPDRLPPASLQQAPTGVPPLTKAQTPVAAPPPVKPEKVQAEKPTRKKRKQQMGAQAPPTPAATTPTNASASQHPDGETKLEIGVESAGDPSLHLRDFFSSLLGRKPASGNNDQVGVPDKAGKLGEYDESGAGGMGKIGEVESTDELDDARKTKAVDDKSALAGDPEAL